MDTRDTATVYQWVARYVLVGSEAHGGEGDGEGSDAEIFPRSCSRAQCRTTRRQQYREINTARGGETAEEVEQRPFPVNQAIRWSGIPN